MYYGSMDATNTTATETVSGNTSAVEIFENQLNAMELLFNFKLDGATVGEKLTSLTEFTRKDRKLAELLIDFLANTVSYASKFCDKDDVFGSMVMTLFATAVRGAVHTYGPMGAPKRQHWLPLAYLSPFGEAAGDGKHNRSVIIPVVSFADGFIMGLEARDSAFIHPKIEGRGFYEDGAEFFFHLVESLYAQGRSCKNRPIDHSLVALFFFVQSVRNPRAKEGFVHSELSAIVEAVLENMDLVGPRMSTKFLKSARHLPFTPYVPSFIHRVGTARVYSMPVEPKTLFAISSEPLEEFSWTSIINRYRRAVVRQAIRRGTHLFGVPRTQLLGAISEVEKLDGK